MKPLAAWLLIGFAFVAWSVSAHDARPIFVQVSEASAGTYKFTWKVPATVPASNLPLLVLPDSCAAALPAWKSTPSGYQAELQSECDTGLNGQVLSLRFPDSNPSLSTLYKVQLLSGEEHVYIAGPDVAEWTIPLEENAWVVSAEYTWLGIEHIWIGIDHLLFVACLVYVARGMRRLIITITGFTIAHSITLALSVLDVIRIPTPPVEAAIALSVVFLAWEIARQKADSLTYRYPAAVSVSFGLLHGLGFAAVLRDIGLPQTELGTALLFFNVGVEIGQLLFVAVVLAGLQLFRRFNISLSPVLAQAPVYVIGVTASFWFFERVASF